MRRRDEYGRYLPECPTCTDADWLITSGETHPEVLATRLGFANVDSLHTHLRRHRRADLRARITRTDTTAPAAQSAA